MTTIKDLSRGTFVVGQWANEIACEFDLSKQFVESLEDEPVIVLHQDMPDYYSILFTNKKDASGKALMLPAMSYVHVKVEDNSIYEIVIELIHLPDAVLDCILENGCSILSVERSCNNNYDTTVSGTKENILKILEEVCGEDVDYFDEYSKKVE